MVCQRPTKPTTSNKQPNNNGRYPRPKLRNRQQNRQISPQQTAPGRNGINPPADPPRLSHIGHRQPDGEGRNHAQQHDRHSQRQNHADQRPGNGVDIDGRHRRGRCFQDDAGEQQEENAGKSGDGDEGVEGVGIRPFIRPAPADEVTQRQQQQHQSNDVGPNDVGRAINGLQHPAGGKFNGQRAHPGHEDREDRDISVDG